MYPGSHSSRHSLPSSIPTLWQTALISWLSSDGLCYRFFSGFGSHLRKKKNFTSLLVVSLGKSLNLSEFLSFSEMEVILLSL